MSAFPQSTSFRYAQGEAPPVPAYDQAMSYHYGSMHMPVNPRHLSQHSSLSDALSVENVSHHVHPDFSYHWMHNWSHISHMPQQRSNLVSNIPQLPITTRAVDYRNTYISPVVPATADNIIYNNDLKNFQAEYRKFLALPWDAAGLHIDHVPESLQCSADTAVDIDNKTSSLSTAPMAITIGRESGFPPEDQSEADWNAPPLQPYNSAQQPTQAVFQNKNMAPKLAPDTQPGVCGVLTFGFTDEGEWVADWQPHEEW